jgi:hypothetical protein
VLPSHVNITDAAAQSIIAAINTSTFASFAAINPTYTCISDVNAQTGDGSLVTVLIKCLGDVLVNPFLYGTYSDNLGTGTGFGETRQTIYIPIVDYNTLQSQLVETLSCSC